MIKIAIFDQKMPVKLPFQHKNDVYRQIPFVGVKEAIISAF